MSRALGSIVFSKLHNMTPSRRVKANTRISASGIFALWSTGIALHRVNQAAHSRHKSSDTLLAIVCWLIFQFQCFNQLNQRQKEVDSLIDSPNVNVWAQSPPNMILHSHLWRFTAQSTLELRQSKSTHSLYQSDMNI